MTGRKWTIHQLIKGLETEAQQDPRGDSKTIYYYRDTNVGINMTCINVIVESIHTRKSNLLPALDRGLRLRSLLRLQTPCPSIVYWLSSFSKWRVQCAARFWRAHLWGPTRHGFPPILRHRDTICRLGQSRNPYWGEGLERLFLVLWYIQNSPVISAPHMDPSHCFQFCNIHLGKTSHWISQRAGSGGDIFCSVGWLGIHFRFTLLKTQFVSDPLLTGYQNNALNTPNKKIFWIIIPPYTIVQENDDQTTCSMLNLKVVGVLRLQSSTEFAALPKLSGHLAEENRPENFFAPSFPWRRSIHWMIRNGLSIGMVAHDDHFCAFTRAGDDRFDFVRG